MHRCRFSRMCASAVYFKYKESKDIFDSLPPVFRSRPFFPLLFSPFINAVGSVSVGILVQFHIIQRRRNQRSAVAPPLVQSASQPSRSITSRPNLISSAVTSSYSSFALFVLTIRCSMNRNVDLLFSVAGFPLQREKRRLANKSVFFNTAFNSSDVNNYFNYINFFCNLLKRTKLLLSLRPVDLKHNINDEEDVPTLVFFSFALHYRIFSCASP